jgi:hypothetical protein
VVEDVVVSEEVLALFCRSCVAHKIIQASESQNVSEDHHDSDRPASETAAKPVESSSEDTP